MEIKKTNLLIILLFLIAIISLGSVAATDDVANTIDTNSADNNEVQLAIDNNEVSTNDTQDNLGIMQNVEENPNSEVPTTSTVNLETTNDEGNFTELQEQITAKIAAGEDLVLTKNYTRVTGESELSISGGAIIIDAQGFTLNGNNLGGIFNVATTGDLTLKNAVLIKGTGVSDYITHHKLGGAIYSRATVKIYNSTFKDNTADYGGAIYNYFEGADFKIVNSTFINNTANIDGSAIHNYYNNGFTIVNSTFINNTATNNYVISNTGKGTGFIVSNSTFINNSNVIIYNEGELFIEDITADENSYINNTGTITSPVVINVLDNESEIHVILDTPMFLQANVTASGIPIIGEFRFIINNKNITATYDEELKMFRAEYTPDFIGTETVTASLTGAENTTVLTASLFATTGHSFYDLNKTIGYAADIVDLNQSYTYDPRTDYDAFVNGIVIDNNLTINGNGYTIDGSELARIFKVTNTGNLTLINTKIINGDSDNNGAAIYNAGTLTINNSTFTYNRAWNGTGGAIYNTGNLTVTNSIFNNNIAYTNGGAIFNYGTLKIANSNFTDNTAQDGGAIYNTGAGLNIVNSTFTNNNAQDGGAIENYGDEFTIINSIFTNNNAQDGGAIYNTGAGLNIVNSTFTDNTAEYGGAIRNYGADFTIINSIFTNNNATQYGCVIHNTGADFTVVNSTFTDNTATSYTVTSYGGVIYNTGDDFTIVNSTFTNNIAQDGGAIYNTGAGLNIVNSIFTNNNAQDGGAIENYGDEFTVVNSTFTNNTAQDGGAIYNDGADFTIINSIFTNNNAQDGGAIANTGAGLNIVNSIFTNNNAQDGGAIENYGANCTISNSTFTDNTATQYGGAIRNYGANCTIVTSTFTDNTATQYGGAIHNSGTNFTIVNSIFTDNTATQYGGAIYNTGADFNILNPTFTNNNAQDGGAIYNTGAGLNIVNSTFTNNNAQDGGAIENYGDEFTVVNSIFTNNTATQYGGAIYNDNENGFSVFNSRFTNNNAINNISRGGAIYSASTKNLISNSTFAYNTATVYGGAIQLDTEKVVSLSENIITYCIFNENVAGVDGSAIFTYTTVSVTDSTFRNNSVAGDTRSNGGAIYIYANESLVDNCTFDSNYAAKHGAAIYLDANNTVISNSKFYNNVADVYGGAILVYGNNNLISNCDFKYNNAPNGTVIGVYEGYNLQIVECINENNSTTAEIYLETNRTSLANVEVIVLGNETIDAVVGDYINVSAIACSSGLNIAGGNLTFFDGVNYYPAESIDTGIYTSRYYVNHTGIRTITAQFTNAEYVELYTGAINGFAVILKVNDVVMYYKNGSIVEARLTYNNQPVAGENITISINGAQYTLTTDDNGSVSLPIGLASGKYNIVSIYNGTYGYACTNSNLTVLSTIIGEDTVLYYRNGTGYYVHLTDGQGNSLIGVTVRMNINGVYYYRETNSNGYAFLPIGLNAGSYVITAENPVNGEMTSNNVTVLATMTGEDITIYHRNGSGYSVKVVDGQGNPAIGVTVKMNVNGVFYTVQTDSEGVATLKIGLSPGDYIITAEYNEFKTSNKITVLPVLVGSDVTLYYRDGTNYTVKAVDGQGNPLIGATVSMNINGVFYNVVTDNSGVASLPIGLLPGKYIITTTYQDHSTSNTVTVLSRD